MAKFDIESAQNVEVSKKLPCEKPLMEQLRIMEEYTETHRRFADASKEQREVECLKVIYPAMFRSIEQQDLIAGRLDFLPIGFGCVTSVGGVGHYCVFGKLRDFQKAIVQEDPQAYERVEALYHYWETRDLKTIYCNEVLTDTTIGKFIDTEYPLIATARLSGMMLDYKKLLRLGVGGLIRTIHQHLAEQPNNSFLMAAVDSLHLVTVCADYLREKALYAAANADSSQRKNELERMAQALENIREDAPRTFHEALQLFWLYALLAGCINYGRIDEFLGPFLAADLDAGRLTEDEAYAYLRSLWGMIENRRTTVNGRIIVGGEGRENKEEADRLMRIAMRVCRDVRYVEPQFTLRLNAETPIDVWDMALEAIGNGATYPTFYNDMVNVPAVAWGMRVSEEEASRYVPFGCTEFVLWGRSTGTPNICINLLKILTIYMNSGIDPMDGQAKLGPVPPRSMEKITSFDEFYDGYKELLNYYLDLSADAQYRSYEIMNEQVGFLFPSILMDDCIERGKPLLDGGVRYLGGTCETYGNINSSDSLWAIRKLVFEEKRFTLQEISEAVLHNFNGYSQIRKACLECEKYGNDLDCADDMANDLYEFVAKGVRDRGIAKGMQYFLIVISNNSLNTEWGLRTGASPDGRLSGMSMTPANNPQGGADKNGPTALLNSLRKFHPRYHAGSVQNIKFEKTMFNRNRKLIGEMFKTYFREGGCHLMVTVVDKGALEDAMVHPEKYPDLIVRVAGYSAVFVDLPRSVQEEILSRTLYGEA